MVKKESERIYKTLKNKITRYPLKDVLLFSWAYSRFFTFGTKLPPEIPNYEIYNQKKGNSPKTWGEIFLSPWEVDIILREYLTYFNFTNPLDRSPLSRRRISDTRDLVFSLTDTLAKENKDNDTFDLNAYMWALGWQQFHWQNRNYLKELQRFFIIYSDPELKKAIQEEIDPHLEIDKLLLLGGAILGKHLQDFYAKFPFSENELTGISKADISYFLDTFSIKLEDLLKSPRLDKKLDEEFEFKFNPIKRYPLIIFENNIYCPQLTYLLDIVTTGLRHIILEKKKRGNVNRVFGLSFEKYCLKIAKSVLSKDKELEVYGDKNTKTKDGTPKTVDIIINNKKTTLFVECKGGYLIKDKGLKSYEKSLDLISGFLYKAYNSLSYYKLNKYPQVKYSNKKTKHLLVVTIDDIVYLPSKDREKLLADIQTQIKKRFLSKKKTFDPSLFDEIPWRICSVKAYESLIVNIRNHNLTEAMNDLTYPESLPILNPKIEEIIDLESIFGVSENIFTDIIKKNKTDEAK
jgi:hypothetical protein